MWLSEPGPKRKAGSLMRRIEEVRPGLLRVPILPRDALNAYVLGDVLVDAGFRFMASRLLASLQGVPISAHALTHAHFDHQGGSSTICRRLEIPFMCGEGDRAAAESGDLALLSANPQSWSARLGRILGGPGVSASRTLREGDEIGGFTVFETPGHTPGHLAFWRQADRALVLGDVLFNRTTVTPHGSLSEPFRVATFSPALNRESARKLAALMPEVVCFGHGPPLTRGEAFVEFVASLPERERQFQ